MKQRTLLQETKHSVLLALRLAHAAVSFASGLLLGVSCNRTVEFRDGLLQSPRSVPPNARPRQTYIADLFYQNMRPVELEPSPHSRASE